ncbi:unnamed protein product [Lampetra planeri]
MPRRVTPNSKGVVLSLHLASEPSHGVLVSVTELLGHDGHRVCTAPREPGGPPERSLAPPVSQLQRARSERTEQEAGGNG